MCFNFSIVFQLRPGLRDIPGLPFFILIQDGQRNGEIKTQETAKSTTAREVDSLGISHKQSSTFQLIHYIYVEITTFVIHPQGGKLVTRVVTKQVNLA